jgi:repressor LexA
MGAMKEKKTIQSVQKIIGGFHRQQRRMPTYQEMLDLLGVRSKSVVHFWVNKLITEGLLQKDPKGHLTLPKQSLAVPLLGSVRAGFPSPEEEALCDVISLDEYLINRPETSFLLQVSGDSMTGAGIMEGDLVIIEKARAPKSGDIVIAEVDGDWTMKYFRRKGKQILLEAANPKYPDIIAQTELRIGGVVTAVIRKYSS